MKWEHLHLHPQPGSRAWPVSCSATIPCVPGLRREGKKGCSGTNLFYPSAVPCAGPHRGSAAGHCLPLHPRTGAALRWILRATCNYCSPETVCPTGAGQRRPKFAIQMTSSWWMYGLNLWRNSPKLTGKGKKFPFLYFCFHFFLFSLQQDHSNKKPVFIFLWKQYWNSVQGKACNISQPHTTYYYWKISFAISAATKCISHLITWPKKMGTSFLFPQKCFLK